VSRTVAIQNSTISIPGFDGNLPARTPAAIRQAAYELIDGMIGDLDVDQLSFRVGSGDVDHCQRSATP
jgi:hypothetical protein